MANFVGIDLGTTFSAAAVIDENGQPKIIHNKNGQNITPSCISIVDNEIEVGELARKTWGEEPQVAAARFKRFMGTSTTYKIGEKTFTPTELSALVLNKMVKDIEAQIGKIDEAVVTIPANFAHEAREATMAAAKAAGLNVKYIINEPTAAALYYAHKNNAELSGIYAVYDLGGGTFDISIIDCRKKDITVLASCGVSRLGGDDFDSAIIKIIASKYKTLTGTELGPDDYSKNAAEEDKKVLSSKSKSIVRIGKEKIEITREEFENAISSLITQAEMLCEAALDEAGIKTSDISGVYLAGGSTRTPCVAMSVKKIFNREPETSANVDEVVALGAAIYAAQKSDLSKLSIHQTNEVNKIQVTESASKCFGTISLSDNAEKNSSSLQNSILIRKGERIPCSVTKSFFTVLDGQEVVNCKVTESESYETDPKFVKIIWQGELQLPPSRNRGQEIKITFSYDANQIMKCEFVDVSTSRINKIDLSLSASKEIDKEKIKKFLVE